MCIDKSSVSVAVMADLTMSEIRDLESDIEQLKKCAACIEDICHQVVVLQAHTPDRISDRAALVPDEIDPDNCPEYLLERSLRDAVVSIDDVREQLLKYIEALNEEVDNKHAEYQQILEENPELITNDRDDTIESDTVVSTEKECHVQ